MANKFGSICWFSVILSLLVILIVNADETDDKMQSDLESALSHMRMVVKNGIKVKGTYSYSDGQFRKTIYYIADNKGYRIVGEDIVALSENQPLRIYPDNKDVFKDEQSKDDLSHHDNHHQGSGSTNPT